MTLNSTDILKIQSAIDRYEKRFPRRPSAESGPGSAILSEPPSKRVANQRKGARSLEVVK
jgi:hypothetical protein